MLVVDHDLKSTSDVFQAVIKVMGSCLVVGSAYDKNTTAKVLPIAVLAINKAAER